MWFFSRFRKNKLITPRDLFSTRNQGHSQVCNRKWWIMDITAWANSPFQDKATSEVGVVEVVADILKVVIKILITALLLHKCKCNLVHLLTCNGIRKQAILRIKIPINSRWWILKVEYRCRQLVTQTSKLSSASSSTKVTFPSIEFCFRKELPIQRSLLLRSWWDRT